MTRRLAASGVSVAVIGLTAGGVSAAGIALSGCDLRGPTSPAQSTRPASPPQSTRPATPLQPTRPATPLAVAAATHEYPSPTPHETAPGAASPVAAITAFATAYINWDAGTVTARMLALARRSVGQARSAMELAAAQTASDYELQRGGIANRGVVEAVSPLRAGQGRWVVVTEEQTTATATNAYQGLQPAWHITVVTVTEPTAGRWVISGWQPEN